MPSTGDRSAFESVTACTAAIVFGVPLEAEAFERLVQDRIHTRAGSLVIREGYLGGGRVAWCVAGAGPHAATRAATLLLDGHRPRTIISAGFAGGLDPSLTRGSVVRPSLAVMQGVDPIALCHASPNDGLILTIDRIVTTPSEKRMLRETTNARLVDMETAAVALVSRAAGRPCAAVRVVSDAASDELPREVTALVQPRSAAWRLGAALGAVGRRPRVALELWRLYEHAVVDGRTLAAAVAETCAAADLSA